MTGCMEATSPHAARASTLSLLATCKSMAPKAARLRVFVTVLCWNTVLPRAASSSPPGNGGRSQRPIRTGRLSRSGCVHSRRKPAGTIVDPGQVTATAPRVRSPLTEDSVIERQPRVQRKTRVNDCSRVLCSDDCGGCFFLCHCHLSVLLRGSKPQGVFDNLLVGNLPAFLQVFKVPLRFTLKHQLQALGDLKRVHPAKDQDHRPLS